MFTILLKNLDLREYRYLNKLNQLIEKIESSNIKIEYYFFTFFCIQILRNFLEFFSSKMILGIWSQLHCFFSFIFLAMATVVLFKIILKVEIKKSFKTILLAFSIIMIAPIVDLIVSGGKGFEMTYIHPKIHGDILKKFFTFWGEYDGSGPTIGIKLEVFLSLLLTFIYSQSKRASILRGLILSAALYILIFFWGASPFVIKGIFYLVGITYHDFYDGMMVRFYLLFIFPMLAALFHLSNKAYFYEILKDLRALRILYYILMFFLGLFIGNHTSNTGDSIVNEETLLTLPLTIIAIFFSCLFSLVVNNIADMNIDSISNPNRPHITLGIKEKDYYHLSFIFLSCSIIYSTFVNYATLYLILSYIAIYFLYSAPPFRLKRVPVFSKMMISINSMIMIIMGSHHYLKTFSLPPSLVIYFFVAVTLMINIIDIKDYEGDKADNIKTLVTILGLEKAKKYIAWFFLLSYPLIPLGMYSTKNLSTNCVYIYAVLGLSQFFLIRRANFKEMPIIILGLITVVTTIVLLLSNSTGVGHQY